MIRSTLPLQRTTRPLMIRSTHTNPNPYAQQQAYGFHRVYRRLLEANNRLVPSREDRRIVAATIKEGMRFPAKVVDVLEESHTVAFLQVRFVNEVDGMDKDRSMFVCADMQWPHHLPSSCVRLSVLHNHTTHQQTGLCKRADNGAGGPRAALFCDGSADCAHQDAPRENV